MNKTRASVIGIALLVLGAGGWWFYGTKTGSSDKKPKEAPPVPVSLATAATRDVPLRLEVTGRTEAYESVTLKARVDGQVQATVFAEGQRVKAGDVLVRLDPADFQARLAQAEANAAKSQAQLAKARADLERYVALKAKGFVSDEKVGEMRTALAAAEATAKADAAAAELARLQLSYATVKAPFAGTVGARLVFPGTAVKVNDTALAVVNRTRPLYASFAVPEKYLPRLRAGMAGGQPLQASIALPGMAEGAIAEVRFIDNAVDAGTGTIQLKAVLPNTDEQFAAGQLVNVGLVIDMLKDAVTIPAEAVQQGPEGPYVYLAKEGVAELRKIRLAATQQGLAVVAEGLAAGDRIVTEGQLRLVPGAKLKPAGEGKPGGEKPPAKP